jgi:ribosome biogenesis protein SSF1/2
MLLNREPSEKDDDSYILTLRHYAIATKKTGVSKRIRRLDPKEIRNRDKKGHAVPNLGKLEDAADYLLDPSAAGYTSASETELDTDAEVEVAESTTRRVLNKREQQRQKAAEKGQDKPPSTPGVEKRAVKLVELGPRLRLRLMKVEDGVCDGKIMWHDFITKSEKEVRKMDQNWDVKRKEKEQRKKLQKENIERKKKEKASAKANGQQVADDDEDVDMDDEEAWLSDDDYDQEGEVEGAETEESEADSDDSMEE